MHNAKKCDYCGRDTFNFSSKGGLKLICKVCGKDQLIQKEQPDAEAEQCPTCDGLGVKVCKPCCGTGHTVKPTAPLGDRWKENLLSSATEAAETSKGVTMAILSLAATMEEQLANIYGTLESILESMTTKH